jgi:hypothetical protein
MQDGVYEVRFKGLVDGDEESVFGYAKTLESAEFLVEKLQSDFPQWHDAHYVRFTLH